jgi:hypothetical protein
MLKGFDMKMTSLVASAMIFSLSAASFALAQTPPAPATPAPAAATSAPAMTDAKKAKSKECSAEADAKGLHGKERKKFREECKHGK